MASPRWRLPQEEAARAMLVERFAGYLQGKEVGGAAGPLGCAAAGGARILLQRLCLRPP
jgi:hypothetical protein